MSANQPTAAWSGPGDPLVVVAGHLVSPQDGFGEIGRMPNGDLRRPNRISTGAGGIETIGPETITGFGTNATLVLRRANGTEANPSAVVNPNVLGGLFFSGFGATGFSTARAALIGAAVENWTDAAQGTELQLSSTAIGGVIRSSRWTIQAAGHFVAATDNVVDIGASGANRPRDIHVGRTIVMGGGAVDNRGLAAIGSDAFLSSVTGDGQVRFGLTADGRMRWGDGTAAPDTSLFRSAANILKTDDAFEIGTDIGLRLVNQVDGAAANAGTLTNAPAAGDPVFWVPVHVNGSTRHFPVW